MGMRRIIVKMLPGMLLGLALGCAAWAVGDQDASLGRDHAYRIFTARFQAMRLGDPVAASRSMPMDQCGACLEICRDMGESYSACAGRCWESCGLGAASAWAEAD